jgi:hypothetical protein
MGKTCLVYVGLLYALYVDVVLVRELKDENASCAARRDMEGRNSNYSGQ